MNEEQIKALFEIAEALGWAVAYDLDSDPIEGAIIGTEKYIHELLEGPTTTEAENIEEAETQNRINNGNGARRLIRL